MTTKKEESPLNIYQKLVEIRKTVPYLKKDTSGPGFKFVSSSATLGSIRAKMDELGVLLVPTVTGHTTADHTTKNGGHQYFVTLDLTFTWIDSENPKDRIICPWVGQGMDQSEKGIGKAMTYAEKYFILKSFNIPTDQDDPDSFQKKVSSKAEASNPGFITDAQRKTLQKLVADTESDIDGFLKYAGATGFDDIPAASFTKLHNMLKSKVKK